MTYNVFGGTLNPAQSKVRPRHSNAHVFKIHTPVFGTIEHRDILNISNQLPNTK